MLRAVELELLNAVIPAYREAAARSQIEISTSPFYHPILPLLCDTEVYKRTHPESRCLAGGSCTRRMPLEQLVTRRRLPRTAVWPPARRAVAIRRLGVGRHGAARRPGGLPVDGHRRADAGADAQDHVRPRRPRAFPTQPEQLYTPYVVAAGGARVACVFRDHTLSDLIGFTYAGWGAAAAAETSSAGWRKRGGATRRGRAGEKPVIPIILDGENAWEHFEDGGRPFLRALYQRLSDHPELRTVTMEEACAARRP